MTILPILDYGDIIYRSAGRGTLEGLDFPHQSANAPYRTHHYTLLLCKLVISLYLSQDPLVDAYL